MDGKQIGAVIGLIVIIPTLLGLTAWSFKLSKDPANPGHVEEGVEIIADAAMPWWLGIFEWLANIKSFGIILLIAFIFFLVWIGEIKT